MKRDDNELERFLDRSLIEYSDVSARDGLEQRILANLAASPEKTKRWWAWALVPACAVLVVAAVLLFRPVSEVPMPPVMASTPAAPALSTHKSPVVIAVKQHKPPRIANMVLEVAKTEPRLPTFPSQPDESQARMLLQFVQGSPQAAQQVVEEEKQFQKLVAQNFEGTTNSDQEQELETR